MSVIVRGGATRLVGAAFARSSAFGASSAFAADPVCLGSDFSIAACTQACTFGLAFSRQASMLPPPARMQAITIGLPTLLRQLSMTSLGLSAATSATPARKTTAATTIRPNIANPRDGKIAHGKSEVIGAKE